MATKFITPNWRMPRNSNQSKASNYSINFSGGGNEYLTIGSSTKLDNAPLGPYSFSFWFKQPSHAGSKVLSEKRAANTFVNAQYAIHSENGFIAWYGGEGASTATYTSSALSFDQWHHIVCVAESTSVSKIYVDGQLDATSSNNRISSLVVVGTFIIGANYGGSYRFIGQLCQYCIFDYALTSNAVTALYNSGIPSNPLAVTTPPIAYYDLGQGSAYASGSAGIVEPNLAAATGSTVFDFDRSSVEYIKIDPPALNFTDKMSFSAWAKFTSTAQDVYTVASNFDPNSGYKFAIYYYRDNNPSSSLFRLRINSANNTLQTYTVNGRLDVDKWYHLAFSFDGTTNANGVNLYIDNVKNSFTATDSGIYPNTSNGTRIGNYQDNNTWAMIGEISNVQFWDTNLQDSDIATLYNNGTPLQSYTDIPQSGSLEAWYKLGLDNSIYNSDDTKWNVQNNFQLPIYNDSLKFFGSYIGGSPLISYPQLRTTTTSVSPGTNGITYSAFIRMPVPVQGNETTLFYANLGSIQVSNKVAFKTEAGAKYKNFNKDLEDGAWHHVLVYVPTPSGTGALTDVKCYVDGEEITDTTIIGGSTYSTAITNIYGIYIGNLTPRHMEISNWAYWLGDKTSDVATIYNGGTPGDISSLNPDVWYKLDSNNVSLTGSNGLDYGSAVDSSGNGNNGRIGGESSDSETLRPVPIIVNNYPIIADNVVSSGMDSTNLVPSNLIKSIPYSGYSMDFDGANDYIDFGDSDDFSFTNNATTDLPFVLSWWLKPDSMNQNIGIAIKKDTEYQLKTDNVGRLKVTLFDSTSGGDIDAAITTNNWLYDGAYIWRNVIVTYDGSGNNTGIDIFLDGEHRGDVVRSGSGTYNFMRNSANSLINGDIGTFEFDGKQSNFAVWRGKTMMTGSSGDQNSIIRIYNGGSPGDLSSLNPTSWWSLGVDSYFDGSNWICPDLGGGGNNGTSANMAADDLVGDGPDSLANGTSTNLDLGSDLIGNAPGSTGNAISVNMNFTARTGSTP